jgi:hypothetical protein
LISRAGGNLLVGMKGGPGVPVWSIRQERSGFVDFGVGRRARSLERTVMTVGSPREDELVGTVLAMNQENGMVKAVG